MSQKQRPASALAASTGIASSNRRPNVETFKSTSVPSTELLHDAAERRCPSNISFEKHNFFLEALCPSDSDDDDEKESPNNIHAASRYASKAPLSDEPNVDRRRHSDASVRLEDIAADSHSRQSFNNIGSVGNGSAPSMMSSRISITGQIEDEIIERRIREGKLKVEEGSRNHKSNSSLGFFARRRGSGASSRASSAEGGRFVSSTSNLPLTSLSSMNAASFSQVGVTFEKERGSDILRDIERALRDLDAEDDDDHADEETCDATLAHVILSTGRRGNAADLPVKTFQSPRSDTRLMRSSSFKRPEERRNWS
mmetsp:Transcript_36800/g.110385  ORF Transcript_36800/g.110385 Transcript_36800/m.110385 type:complete len:312 (-) Transcript_36800:83-1018(-)